MSPSLNNKVALILAASLLALFSAEDRSTLSKDITICLTSLSGILDKSSSNVLLNSVQGGLNRFDDFTQFV